MRRTHGRRSSPEAHRAAQHPEQRACHEDGDQYTDHAGEPDGAGAAAHGVVGQRAARERVLGGVLCNAVELLSPAISRATARRTSMRNDGPARGRSRG